MQPNLSRLFAGRRVLVTMCRDEPVERIADWAHWHADRHSFDAVLPYDNGSAATTRGEITEALHSVPGIEAAVTLDWPGVAWLPISEPPWAAIEAWSQRGSIRHAILRFLQQAESVFCCDVDELLVSFDPAGAPLIDSLLADDSVDAVRFMSQDAVLPGSTPSGLRHQDVEAFTGDLRRKFKWLARPHRFGFDRLPDQHNPDLPATVEPDPAHARLAHTRQLTTGWGGRHVRLDPAPANPAFDAESRELRRQLDEVHGRWSWTAPASAPPAIDDLCRDAWMFIDAGDHAAALARFDAALAE